MYLVNSASFIFLNKNNHKTADNLNIWLHISSEILTVLNLNGILLLIFLYIDCMLIYDILVFCFDLYP